VGGVRWGDDTKKSKKNKATARGGVQVTEKKKGVQAALTRGKKRFRGQAGRVKTKKKNQGESLENGRKKAQRGTWRGLKKGKE